jgi:hypothetical protein
MIMLSGQVKHNARSEGVLLPLGCAAHTKGAPEDSSASTRTAASSAAASSTAAGLFDKHNLRA